MDGNRTVRLHAYAERNWNTHWQNTSLSSRWNKRTWLGRVAQSITTAIDQKNIASDIKKIQVTVRELALEELSRGEVQIDLASLRQQMEVIAENYPPIQRIAEKCIGEMATREQELRIHNLMCNQKELMILEDRYSSFAFAKVWSSLDPEWRRELETGRVELTADQLEILEKACQQALDTKQYG